MVGEHFNLPGHDLADFNFLPFEKVRSGDPFVVETRESFWIQKYGVLGEGGMNRRSWEINGVQLKKTTLFGRFFKKLQCVFSIFTFSNWLFKPVQPWIFASLSFTWRGTVSIQPVCPKVLVKCKSSNIQHEHVGEWFEFLRQIPFVNIALIVWSQL